MMYRSEDFTGERLSVCFIAGSLVARFDEAVGRRLDIVVDGDGADAVCHDVSGRGVLDVGDGSTDVGLQGAVLEGAVARGVEGAVLQYQVVGVAQGLFAGDVAVDEAEVLRVPAEVFAVQFGVVDGDVLHFPEGVFGGYLGVVYLDVLHVLEDVFAVALQAIHVDVVAEHEGEGAFVQGEILDADAVAAPEDFVGIVHPDVFYLDVVHLAEHFGGVDDGVAHR